MERVKAVPVNEPKPAANAAGTEKRPSTTKNKMKPLSKIALIAAVLTAAVAAQAEWVSGHFRSSGTYVAPYYRTPANGIPYDNLSYRGYPSQQPGYISPRAYDYGTVRTLPAYPSTGYVRPLYRNPYAF